MADVKLSRPAQGQHIVVPSTPDARMILDFSADQVNIDRPEGSNSLFFQFGDGASIELQNFYTAYNKEEMPEFQIDGQIIAGTDFFQAFGPDLLPAAGPAASAERGARYSEYANMNLAEGTWHLNELDYRLAFDGRQSTDEWQHGVIDNLAPTFSTGGAPITLGLTETGWDGKSPASPAPSVTGSFTVQDPDGDSLTATVAIGGKTVVVSLAGPTTVESDYGSLVITPKGGGSNVTFNFEYTLKEEPYSKTDQLAQGEQVTDGIVITVNDGMGHTVTQPINVVITGSNDAPDITGVSNVLTFKEGGVYADGKPLSNTPLNADENTAVAGTATLSGLITAHDPDHGAQLYFGLTDANGNLLDMTNVNANGSLKGVFVIGTVNNPDNSTSAVTVTGISEHDGKTTIHTDYGDLVLEKTGDESATYTFSLTNTTGEGATNKLAEGQTVKLNFEPYVRDEHGVVDSSVSTLRDGTVVGNTINVVIEGTNDAPIITQNFWSPSDPADADNTTHSVTVSEAADDIAHSTVSGTFVASDVDNGDHLTYGLVRNDGSGDLFMHNTVYVVLNSDGKTFTTTAEASTDATKNNYVGEFHLISAVAPASGVNYEFTLYNESPAVQGMQKGDSQNVSVVLTARDSFGAYVQESISVTVKGANDTPVITKAPLLTDVDLNVVEEGVKAVAGKEPNTYFAGTSEDVDPKHSFTVTDVDNNDKQTVSITVTDRDGNPVSLPVTDDGKGNYTVTTPEGTFTLEAGKPNVGDSGSSQTYTYSYVIDNDAADNLDEGEKRKYIFTVTIEDSKGASDSQTIGLTVTGTNDKPVLTITPTSGDKGELTEDVTTTSSGKWAVTDPDQDGNKQTISVSGMGKAASGDMDTKARTGDPVVVTTDYGKLTLKPDGTYTYELDENKNNLVVQGLGAGQSHTETFNVTTTDKHGAHDNHTITVTINGSNDKPVIDNSSITSVSVVEAGVQGSRNPASPNADYCGTEIATGRIVATDVDDNDKGKLNFSVADDGKGKYGTLTLDATTGEYKYKLDNDNDKANSLNEGQKVTETFTVTVNDAHGGSASQEITVNITGANDRPALSLSPPSAILKEGSDATSTGKFEVVDPDQDGAFKEFTNGKANQIYSIASGSDVTTGTGVVTYTTEYGTLTVNPNGTYEYVLNNDSHKVKNLGATEKHVETFNVKVTDLHGSFDTETVEFTIQGTNNAPSISGKTSGALTVKEAGVTSGTETTIPHYANQVENGTTTATGSFTVKDMDTHDTLTATLTSNSTTITVPDMSGAGVWTVDDAYGTLTITGVRSVSATDGSESITYTYTYEIDQTKANALAEDKPETLDYHISVTDGRSDPVTHDIKITVQGTNDAPTVTAETLTLKDDGCQDGGNTDMPSGTGVPAAHGTSYVASVEGALKGVDSDQGASLTYGLVNTTSGTGAYKHLGTDSGELSKGTVAGTFVKDGATQTTAISAEMDASTGAYPGTGVVATVISVYAEGKPHTADNLYGTLYLNEATGKYTFTLATGSSVVNALGSGETLTLNFQAVAVDEHSASSNAITVPIVIYGTNDKPSLVLPDEASRTVQEDVTTSVSGNVGNEDADVNDTHTYSIRNTNADVLTLKGEHGTLVITKSGAYTYYLNNDDKSVQSLDAASTPLQDTFTIRVTDNYGAWDEKPLTIFIKGSNDAPVFSTSSVVDEVKEAGQGDPYGNVNNSGSPTTTGTIAATDVDAGEHLTYSFKVGSGNSATYPTTITTQYGTVAIDPTTGVYTYTLNDNDVVNMLQAGQTVADTFTVVAKDPTGLSAEQKLIVNVIGTNDRPIINAVDNLTLKEDSGEYTKTGSVSATDIDLPEGKSLSYSLVEHASGRLVQTEQLSGKYGYLELDQNTGTYTYHLDNTKIQNLGVGESIVERFDVRVTDNLGAYSDSVITVTINGADDKPSITSASSNMTEDTTKVTGSVEWRDTDTSDTLHNVSLNQAPKNTYVDDAGHAHEVIKGTYGDLDLDASTGSYTYTLTTSKVQYLNEGQSLRENFPITLTTGNSTGSSSIVGGIAITINGSDDAPYFTDSGFKSFDGTWNGGDVGGNVLGLWGSASTSGQVYAADVDNHYYGESAGPGQTETKHSELTFHFAGNTQTYKGEYGSITLDPNTGKYVYMLDVGCEKYVNLHIWDTKSETFTVFVTDSQGKTDSMVIKFGS